MRRLFVFLSLTLVSAFIVACHGEVRGAIPSSMDREMKKQAKECDKGKLHACHNVAIALLSHEDTTQEQLDLSRRLLTDACTDGLGLSCRRLAEYAGDVADSPDETSEEVLHRSCAQGDRNACVDLASHRVEAGAYDAGLMELDALCQRNSTYACVELGRLLFQGPSEIRDVQQAIIVLNGPCGNGSPTACRLRAEAQISVADSAGDITRNIIKQLGEACLAADERACRHLAGLYAAGIGVEQDGEYAQSLLRRACDVPSPTNDCKTPIPAPVFDKPAQDDSAPDVPDVDNDRAPAP